MMPEIRTIRGGHQRREPGMRDAPVFLWWSGSEWVATVQLDHEKLRVGTGVTDRNADVDFLAVKVVRIVGPCRPGWMFTPVVRYPLGAGGKAE